MRPLSNIQERVERSLEYALYMALVTNGYTPDRQLYANDPVGYDTAVKAVKTDKGFHIELFGHGVSHDRDVKKLPRIVINGRGFYPGDTGNEFAPTYKAQAGYYVKQREGFMYSNYRFEITILSNSTSQDRILEAVRQAVMPNLGYITMYDNPKECFLVEYGFMRQNPDLIQGMIEKTYTYEAKDIKEQEPAELDGIGPIAKLKEITIREGNEADLIKKNSLVLGVTESSSISDIENTILN